MKKLPPNFIVFSMMAIMRIGRSWLRTDLRSFFLTRDIEENTGFEVLLSHSSFQKIRTKNLSSKNRRNQNLLQEIIGFK